MKNENELFFIKNMKKENNKKGNQLVHTDVTASLLFYSKIILSMSFKRFTHFT